MTKRWIGTGSFGLRVLVVAAALGCSLEGCASAERADDGDGGPDADGPCGADERVASGRCIACPPGSSNPGGDEPDGPDTMCEPQVCGEGERVRDNACFPCAPGQENAAGDVATGPDTTCETRVCGEDQRVASNACVPCAAGATNAAGDVATGTDTACDPILCEENERVVDNACAACPDGETNDPGDDAIGPDTFCDDPCEALIDVGCELFDGGYIKASNTATNDSFGGAIDLDGDTLVVGAVGEDGAATDVDGDEMDRTGLSNGAAYVYRRSGGAWAQEAYLKASNGADLNFFGQAVAVSGDTVVVGAPFESSDATGIDGDQENAGAPRSGAAYVFVRSGDGTWSQEAFLKASNTGTDDGFGRALAIDGDTIAVGAPGEGSAATGIDGDQANDDAPASGAVYVFTRGPEGWRQEAYLKASNTGGNDNFGGAVALYEDTLVVGAVGESSSATAVDGPEDNDDSPASGAAYVFVRDPDGSWRQDAYLKASNAEAADRFGTSVAVGDGLVAVGASGEDGVAEEVDGDESSNGFPGSGAAYVFERDGDGFRQTAYVKAPLISSGFGGPGFGFAVAIEGDRLAVSTASDGGGDRGLLEGPTEGLRLGNSGAVHVYGRAETGWTRLALIKASNADPGDRFGSSLALSNGTLAIGASGESSDATGVNGDEASNAARAAGAAYLRRIAPE